MTPRSYVGALDNVLLPLGFIREGRDWLRTRDGILECVNMQVSSFAGTTANIYTKDLATDAILNEALPSGTNMPMFQTSVRIGGLIDGNDRWWRRDPKGPQELSEAIVAYALPYLDQPQSLEVQAQGFGRESKRWFNAAIRIYLAITLYRMGELDEACAALANPPKRLLQSWLTRVEAVRRRLGCGEGCS